MAQWVTLGSVPDLAIQVHATSQLIVGTIILLMLIQCTQSALYFVKCTILLLQYCITPVYSL